MAKYDKQISVGYDADGKRVRKWIHADSRQELKRKEKELLRESEKHTLTSISLGDYAAHWFQTYKSNKETRTKEYYQSAIKKLDRISQIPIAEIRRSQLQSVISDNWEHPRTCKKIHDAVSQIFRMAAADGIILRNPAEGLELPRYQKTEKRILTEAEKAAIRNADLPPAERMFLDLIRECGLRPEEARALTRSSIDLKEGTLSITQATIFDQNRAELKDTKNLKHRTLPLSKSILERLRRYLKDVKFILFTDSKGNLMSKSSFRCFQDRIFKAINKELGGSDTIDALNGMTFYTLRHTKGTELYYLTQSAKISTKLAAQYMGHSEIVFLSTYSHIDKKKEEIELLRAVTNL